MAAEAREVFPRVTPARQGRRQRPARMFPSEWGAIRWGGCSDQLRRRDDAASRKQQQVSLGCPPTTSPARQVLYVSAYGKRGVWNGRSVRQEFRMNSSVRRRRMARAILAGRDVVLMSAHSIAGLRRGTSGIIDGETPPARRAWGYQRLDAVTGAV